MKITQIRNATLIIEFAGKKFLIDPLLADKDAYPGFEGSYNSHLRQPVVNLPLPIESIVQVDAVIVTHTHLDHWDEVAIKSIPKSIPIYAQNEADASSIRESGFKDVRLLSDSSEFDGVKLIKTNGKHSTEAAYEVIGSVLGEVCGVVFKHASEKSLYLVGDCILDKETRENIQTHHPDVIILNCGDALFEGLDPILMNEKDVLEISKLLPNSEIIATHLDGVGLTRLTRAVLRSYIHEVGIATRVSIPEDGETVHI